MGRNNRLIKTERTQIHFLSDVLVVVASLDLQVPNDKKRSTSPPMFVTVIDKTILPLDVKS